MIDRYHIVCTQLRLPCRVFNVSFASIEASAETTNVSMALVEAHEVELRGKEEEDLELALANMTVEGNIM